MIIRYLDALLKIGEIAGSGVLILGFVNKVWFKEWYDHYKKNRDQFRTLVTYQLEELNKKVNNINAQVNPNGGSSMNDDVKKILDNQAVIKETQDAVIYLDSTPTFRCNIQGDCIFVNVAWLKLSGYNDPTQAYGVGWSRSIYRDDRERVLAEFKEAVRTETQLISTHRKINIITNQVIPVTVMTRYIRNSKKDAIEIMGVIQINQ